MTGNEYLKSRLNEIQKPFVESYLKLITEYGEVIKATERQLNALVEILKQTEADNFNYSASYLNYDTLWTSIYFDNDKDDIEISFYKNHIRIRPKYGAKQIKFKYSELDKAIQTANDIFKSYNQTSES